MNNQRIVTGSLSSFYRAGNAITVPAAGTGSVDGAASASNKPDITDPLWEVLGPVKWSKQNTSKTEPWLTPAPGTYSAQDEITLSVGLTLKGKLEMQSNLAVQLVESASVIPASPAAGGVYNPLAGSPTIKGWLHIQEYNQFNVLINTVDRYVSLKVTGDTNNDDKATETPVEALVLQSTLNVGNLS